MSYYLGFDFGEKRIGVALGQNVTNSAIPMDILFSKCGKIDWEYISGMVNKWDIKGFVVGMPFNMDGSDQKIKDKVEKFADKLNVKFKLPVYFFDERLTTKAAIWECRDSGTKSSKKAIKSGRFDHYAAKIILENWLVSEIL